MEVQPLAAHSIQEAFLYALITPCDVCDQMCVRPDPPQPKCEPGAQKTSIGWVVTGVCDNCQSAHRYRFDVGLQCSDLAAVQVHDPLTQDTPINPTGERSEIIDLVQWVSLHAHFVEAATRTPDRQEARWNLIRAGECLDEALRFFDGDELPIRSAAFATPTRRVLAAHSSRYTRSQLLEQRRKCPTRN